MPKLEGEISDKESSLGALVEFELWPRIRIIIEEGNATLENEIKEETQSFVEKYLKHYKEDEDVQKIFVDIVRGKIRKLSTDYMNKLKGEER